MRLAHWLSTASSGLAVALLLTGCGDLGAPPSRVPAGHAATETRTEAAAIRPTGPTERSVSYRCLSGREDTIAVDVPDVGHLADILDRIQPCEYDQGLSRATLIVTCQSGLVAVHMTGAGGRLRQPSHEALCL